MKRILTLLTLLLCLPLVLTGQDVQFTATAPGTVSTGEQFVLTYSVNAKASDFRYDANMGGLNILSGPNSSTSQQFEWINGKASQSTNTSYTFYLTASKTGTFTIPAATVVVNGKKHTSNQLKINVRQGANPQNGGGGSNNTAGNRRNDAGVVADGDIFVTGRASKKDVYVGEQLVFTHDIYTRVDLAGFNDTKFPAFTGFWKEDVEIGSIQLHRTNVGNSVYYADEIQRNILFPQKSGDIVIEPAEIEVVAKVKSKSRSGIGDPFFDNFFQTYQNVNYTCKSKPVTIHVKPLPVEGKPGSFTGAVGNFTMSGTIDKNSLKANEAVTIKYIIKGEGNVRLIDKINVNFPYDFEVYEPKVTQDIKINNNVVSGTKVFEYVIIPRNEGNFTIKPFEFSYFNPQSKKYITLHTPEMEVHVEKGEAGTNGGVVHGVDKEDVVSIGQDIRYLMTTTPDFGRKHAALFATPLYFVILTAILLLFIVALILVRKHIKNINDVAGTRRRKADAVAMKRLKKAKEYMDAGKSDDFYDEVGRAMWQYVGDRFNVPNADLNRNYLVRLEQTGKLTKDNIDKFIALIDKAEFARFAHGKLDYDMNYVYEEAIDVIKLFYSKLK